MTRKAEQRERRGSEWFWSSNPQTYPGSVYRMGKNKRESDILLFSFGLWLGTYKKFVLRHRVIDFSIY